MRKLILLSAACLLASGSFAPALAKSKDNSSCGFESYSDLIGQNVSEARNAGPNYRLLTVGTNPGPVQPDRLTFFYDARTDRIVSVACG